MVLLSTSRWVPRIGYPLEGEVQAIIWALHVARDIGFSSLEIEYDNLLICHGINRAYHNLSVMDLLLEGISILLRSFLTVHFGHCNKEANEVAHNFVRIASPSSLFLVWMKEVLSCVNPFMDLNVLNIHFCA